MNSFPSIDINRSTGRIFVVYADKSTGSSDVYLRFSDNQGASWSGAIMVNSASSTQQWFPSVSVDQSDGKVYVSYYDMDGIGYTTSHYVAVSSDNGLNFTRTKVSDLSFTPKPLGSGYANGYMGDYYEIKAANGYIFPCWSHDNNPEAKFQAYISPIGGAQINLDQKLSNNTTVDKIDFWSSSIFKELQIPKVYHFKPVINHILRGDQEILTNEKYNKWNVDNNVVNHRIFSFEISPAPQALTSQFSPTYSSMLIKNNLEASSINGGTISLTDPWFIDFNESPYGKRNRGMADAYPWERSSPFYPDFYTNYNGNTYKGVFLNQGYPNWSPPYYSVKAISPQDISLSQTGKTHRFYFQNWGGTNVDYEHADQLQTGVVFTDVNAVAYASMKGTQLSNNQNAYDNNSQRKFVRTDNGYLHNVYESFGKVWYETSFDNGNTWVIRNNGHALSTANSKSPSLTVVDNDQVLIVFQEQVGFGFQFRVINYNVAFDEIWDNETFIYAGVNTYGFDAQPVIHYCYNSTYQNFMISWRDGEPGNEFYPAGLYYIFGTLASDGGKLLNNIVLKSYYYFIANTDQYSINPSLVGTNNLNPHKFHLAWEQNGQIKYCMLTKNQNGAHSCSSIETPSAGGGYNSSKPSIALYWTQQSPVLSWLAEHPVTYQMKAQLRIKYNGITWSQFWIYYFGGGDNILSTNINNNANGKFVLALGGDGESYDHYITSYSPTAIYSLLTQGDVQVSNAGTTMGDMRIMSFDRISSLHDFTSSAVTQGLYKIPEKEVVSKGFCLTKDKSVFSFDFGGIEADENQVLFNDSFEQVDSSSVVNRIETENFQLNNNSKFSFRIDYHSLSTAKSSPVKFKLKLLDASTGKLIGTLKEEDRINVQYDNSYFLVNTDGIGNREVKLRLDFETNEYTTNVFTSVVRDSAVLNKENY